MTKLSDKQIVSTALKVYAEKLRGKKERTEILDGTLKRVEELQTKEIKGNSIGIVIQLDI